MRFIRQIIGDPMSGGLLAAVLAVLLLLQGALGASAQAAMAGISGEAEIICSAHPVDTKSPRKPADDARRNCCLAACQIAASLLMAPAAKASPDIEPPAAKTNLLPATAADERRPWALGFGGEARGPPSFSA